MTITDSSDNARGPKKQQQQQLEEDHHRVDSPRVSSTTEPDASTTTRRRTSSQKRRPVVVDPVVALVSVHDSPSSTVSLKNTTTTTSAAASASFRRMTMQPNHHYHPRKRDGRPSARSTKQQQAPYSRDDGIQQQQQQPDDRLGKKILTNLLQCSRQYRKQQRENADTSLVQADLRWKMPLISRHNWNVCVAYYWNRRYPRRPLGERKQRLQTSNDDDGWVSNPSYRPTVASTLLFGLQIGIGSIILGTILLVWICWKVVHIGILVVQMILPWILDWDDFRQYWWPFQAHPSQTNPQDDDYSIRDAPKLSQWIPPPLPVPNTQQRNSFFSKVEHANAIFYCHQRIMEVAEHSPRQKRPKHGTHHHKKNPKPTLENNQHPHSEGEHEEYSTDNLKHEDHNINTTNSQTQSTRSNPNYWFRNKRRSTPSPNRNTAGGGVFRKRAVSSPDEIVVEEHRLSGEIGSTDDAVEVTATRQPRHSAPLSNHESLEWILSQEEDENGDDEEEEERLLLTTSELADQAEDLDWLDVGARIGLKVLHSEHIQRAMASQETKDRIFGTIDASLLKNKKNPGGNDSPHDNNNNVVASQSSYAEKTTPQSRFAYRALPSSEPRLHISKPMHSLWTSPSAAAAATMAPPSFHDDDDPFLADESSSPIKFTQTFPASPSKSSSAAALRQTWSPGLGLPQRQNNNWNVSSPCRRRYSEPSVHSSQDAAFNVSPVFHSTIIRRPLETDTIPPTCPPDPPPMETSRPHRSCDSVSPIPNARKRRSAYASQTTESFHSVRSSGKVTLFRRAPLLPGVKVALPIYPVQPGHHRPSKTTAYQMSTVKESRRIFVGEGEEDEWRMDTNCLSVTVLLDKSFLRNGMFAELTFRVMDDWGPRYMPRHSKEPIGSCIATSFGVGVLVGWRVEDDCHVVRSLWQNRGPGTAHAYLNRNAIHRTIEAAMGFRVQTMFGWGIVRACINIEDNYRWCRFLVEIKEANRHQGHVLELERKEILSCHGAQFLPVIEHIREAALYQIQVDNYKAAMREQRLLNEKEEPTLEQEFLRSWTVCADILWNSFLKAVEEDEDFDNGVNNCMKTIIEFLERLDQSGGYDSAPRSVVSPSHSNKNGDDVPSHRDNESDEIEVQLASSKEGDQGQEPGFWIMNNLFGGFFEMGEKRDQEKNEVKTKEQIQGRIDPCYFDRAFAATRILMKTVSIARAASVEHPHFRLALAIFYDFLLFIRTVIKVQQKNTSIKSLQVWKRALEEIIATFGPIKQRLESIAIGIAQRMEQQGRKAKIRVLKFVDRILGDERLLLSLEHGEWDKCLARLEIALVEAEIIQKENLIYYRKAAKFVFDHLRTAMESDGVAAARNTEKLAIIAQMVQSSAAPRRSLLKLFCRDDVLEIFERILVRAYYKEDVATRMLTIHASNFHSLRHLRMLKDFSVAGRIWIPLLDAADEEFSWLTSKMPENSKTLMCPLSSLFSLCVVQFHKINAGDLSKDWLAFLLEDESVRIIHDIDMLLILAVESFSKDIREMMTVLPYYPSIDKDILKLVDEMNLDEFLKEISEAIDDPEKLSQYVREKATIGIERFLNYLPKMSIPVEKRDLGEGWMLTCQGEDGGDLTLSDVTIKRENLVCQVMGGDTLFFPMFGDEEMDYLAFGSRSASKGADDPKVNEEIRDHQQHEQLRLPQEEESVLDHIRELIVNAQKFGCWVPGVGGVGQQPTDRYAASVLHGIPITKVLNCAIELWRNIEIDDDELLEIAIRDISYQIQLQMQREDGGAAASKKAIINSNLAKTYSTEDFGISHSDSFASSQQQLSTSLKSTSTESDRHRFNPRVDPTVLFLEIKRLTLNLDNFFFRIEKSKGKTIFDPVFEGRGMVSLKNVSIRLRVECAKERVIKKASGMDVDISSPILQLRDLEVKLEKLLMTVRDTGFGSDWILNKAVKVFEDNLTVIVEENLKEQIRQQLQNVLDNLNSQFMVNPSLLLNVLGISMDDLDENVVWV